MENENPTSADNLMRLFKLDGTPTPAPDMDGTWQLETKEEIILTEFGHWLKKDHTHFVRDGHGVALIFAMELCLRIAFVEIVWERGELTQEQEYSIVIVSGLERTKIAKNVSRVHVQLALNELHDMNPDKNGDKF